MPLDNNLNIAELLRRIGVKGDSLGSAPLLESIRLSLLIGDLSDQVPPVGVPLAGASILSVSGPATHNKWALECFAPGGLTVTTLRCSLGNQRIWVTNTVPFGARIFSAQRNFSFGQLARSIFSTYAVDVPAVPPNQLQIATDRQPSFGNAIPNWVGPGQFFNIESEGSNNSVIMSITWKEYPAALNPPNDRI